MIVRSNLSRRAGIAAALIAGGALLVPAAANAAPAPAPVSQTAAVPGTQCNVGQVERATAKVAPKFWQHVSSNAKAKDRFEQMLVKTPAQRQADRAKHRADHEAKMQQWRAAHPGQTPPAHTGKNGQVRKAPTAAQKAKRKAAMQQKITQVKATCATS